MPGSSVAGPGPASRYSGTLKLGLKVLAQEGEKEILDNGPLLRLYSSFATIRGSCFQLLMCFVLLFSGSFLVPQGWIVTKIEFW